MDVSIKFIILTGLVLGGTALELGCSDRNCTDCTKTRGCGYMFAEKECVVTFRLNKNTIVDSELCVLLSATGAPDGKESDHTSNNFFHDIGTAWRDLSQVMAQMPTGAWILAIGLVVAIGVLTFIGTLLLGRLMAKFCQCNKPILKDTKHTQVESNFTSLERQICDNSVVIGPGPRFHPYETVKEREPATIRGSLAEPKAKIEVIYQVPEDARKSPTISSNGSIRRGSILMESEV